MSIKDASKKRSWQMFNRIAKTYDSVNRLLSFGLDIRWRKKVGQLLPAQKELILLDLATGTADQVLMLCNEHHDQIKKAVGMDLSEGMLSFGREKVKNQNLQSIISLETGDAVNIPAEEKSFDAITISFGIRNVPDVSKSLEEMVRVLKPSGKALILEFSMPKNPLIRFGHLFYLRYVLPLVGGLVSGDYEAYRYLNTSIEAFPYGDSFAELMSNAGFSKVHQHELSFGIATVYEGIR
jgi:demethylmenaquinone methyltransferase / 2-methoxy-6-polyprenyl-1,4-benzoquinol methylase